jgi:hypothetical protein
MILGKTPQPKLPLEGRSPQNFPEWLEAATWNLVPSAKTRVRPEIEGHYAEGVQYHLQNGLSDSAAQAAALADLGDAQAAAKRFGEEYLTTQEVNQLKALRARVEADEEREKADPQPEPTFWQNPLVSNSLWFLLLIIAWEYWHPMNSRQFLCLAVSLLALLVTGALFYLMIGVWIRKGLNLPIARPLVARATLRWLKIQLLWVTMFTYVFVGIFSILNTRLSNSLYWSVLLAVVFAMIQALASIFALAKMQSFWRLRKKLVDSPEEREKLFPKSADGQSPPDPFPN